MAFAAATGLSEQVKEVMIWYKDLISGSEDEFKQLQDDLSTLKGFLKEKEKNGEFSKLEMQIREVLHEMQDTIDIEICLPKTIEAKSSDEPSSVESGFSLSKELYDKLRSLLEKVEKLPDSSQGEEDPQTDSRMASSLKNRFSRMREDKSFPQTEFGTDMPIRQDRVVGFEKKVALITKSLKQENKKLGVISIFGMPGMGKTTLAWKIYESEEIACHFPIRIWINMTPKFNSRDAFLQILRKFIPYEDVFNLDDHELAQTVSAYLEGEKFLLVLDNISNGDVVRDIINEMLVLENGKSKFLLTSRKNLSSSYPIGISRTKEASHKLKYLSAKESWTLLQYEVFGEIDKNEYYLNFIVREIAIKCHRHPIAIVVIGGILLDLLKRGSVIPTTESDKVLNKLMRWPSSNFLELSYNVLPYDMRDCFVYMSTFPEDYEIPVKMLLRLWIAEGFIQSKDGRTLEENGEEILNYLIRRNLLMAQRTNHMGKVKTCRIHEMVREFCTIKSEERFCFSSNLSRFLYENPSCPHVGSSMCFYNQPAAHVLDRSIHLIPDDFPKLRILEFKSVKFHKFPEEFTTLIHLRYLTLFIDALEILPESISKLWNLQTLVVDTKRRSVTMKANMWKMFQLRHLKTKAAIVLDSTWDGEAGQNLQTLNRLSPESFTESFSKRAKNLKTLGISGELGNIFETKFLENLHALEKLKLVNSKVYELTSEEKLPSLPQLNCFPPKLKRLTLTNTFLEWKHMSTLAKIDTLKVLKLKDNAFIGICWNAMNDCFHQLQALLIVNAHLVFWEASEESFPLLKCVVLKNCENLEEIPMALAKSLQGLDIDHLCQSAVDSARKIAELKRKSAVKPLTLNIGPSCF